MKIFYSWQMDAPRKTNKDFIHGALMQAIGQVGEELDVSEAEREEISVDQDTQGVLGSPDIVRVILEKITSANVVIADVSLVANGKDNKPHINSNVAIELGYTYGKLGDEAVLKVMNTNFGPAIDLPFDLRTRRHPVQYCLKPDADAEAVASEQKKLAGQLASILKLYLGQVSAGGGHVETPFTTGRGFYWRSTDVLVPLQLPYQREDAFCNAPCVIYFRCIPTRELPDLSSQSTYDGTVDLQPLLSEGGYSRSRNRWGAASHCLAQDGDFLGFTQLFKNREIWGVDAYYGNLETRPKDDDKDFVAKRFVPTGAVQRKYPRAIDSIRKAAANLGYGDTYIVEMGISGANGLHLAIDSRYWESFPGPIFDDDVFIRQTVTQEQSTGEIMNAFWEKLFSEAGRGVPDELIWTE